MNTLVSAELSQKILTTKEVIQASGLSMGKEYEEPALQIKAVRKQFKDFVALQHIDLDLKQGELLCFLGPSGCGKTTLLRLIAGLDELDQGCIIKNGQDISRTKTEKRRCGIVFQNYALFPNLTIAANIAYGLQGIYWNETFKKKRVNELLDMIGLSGSEHKYPLQLSGGQQQRVALARAIAPEPDILLLDEPLSALDARVRLHLRQEIRALQQRLNLPTILVTHDQEEALTLADRIIVMNHGVIEQVDTPERIYHHPASRFVATFVGHMNLLPAKIKAKNLISFDNVVDINRLLAKQFIANTPIEIGFRPEAARVALAGEMQSGEFYLTAYVVAREFLGAKTRVHLSMQPQQAINDMMEHKIQVDVDHAVSRHIVVGEHIRIAVDIEQLHVFDAEGGAL